MQVGYFRPLFHFILEAIQDRAIVTMEYGILCYLLNGAISNYLEWPAKFQPKFKGRAVIWHWMCENK